MANASVREMPVKLRLELVPSVRPDGVNPKRKRVDHVIEKTDRVLLRMPSIDSERPNPRGIVDGRVLIATGDLAVLADQLQKSDIHLDVVPRHLLFVSVGRDRASTDPAG